jgi:uncharacterized delta-60 repeat protein
MPLENTLPTRLPKGILDTTFAGDGTLSLSLSAGTVSAEAIAIQANGAYVVAGWIESDDGSQDIAMAGDDKAFEVAIQADGKVVVVGEAQIGNASDFVLARYTAEGELDCSFSSDGILITVLYAGADTANKVAVQTDGKIVVDGSRGNDIAIKRYEANGALDTTFSLDGIYTGSFGSQVHSFNSGLFCLDSGGHFSAE